MVGENKVSISMMVLPEEELDIKRILEKPIKEEFDLAQLGDIIGSVNARGDFDIQ